MITVANDPESGKRTRCEVCKGTGNYPPSTKPGRPCFVCEGKGYETR